MSRFDRFKLPVISVILLLSTSACLYVLHCETNARNSFLANLSKANASMLEDLLDNFDRALTSANLTYFLISGSLLGSYRHHGRIPWDDDVDVILNVTEKSDIQKALLTLEPNYRLFSTPYTNSDEWKFFSTKGNPLQNSVHYRSPYIDLFFYRENLTHLISTSTRFPTDYYPKKFVFPLIRRPFGKLRVLAPCSTLQVLESTRIDPSMCHSAKYNHIEEKMLRSTPAEIPCHRLHDYFPFVHRNFQNGFGNSQSGMVETLKKGASILNTVVVDRCTMSMPSIS